MNEFVRVLRSHKVVNVSYVEDGIAHCCALWYASDGLKLYFLSSTTTRHGRVFETGCQVGFTINRDDQNWETILGIQGLGRVDVEDSEDAWSTYLNKYPFARTLLEKDEGDETKLWVISPSWLRLIDNSVRFGYKLELSQEEILTT